jgi:LuxR family transcriptional regulator, maltose regulon positive regulatory protein
MRHTQAEAEPSRPSPSADGGRVRTSLAKITMPSMAHSLPRQALFESLDQFRSRRLIWLAAPAGYGKTTGVSGYLRARGYPAVWYQCDDGDADIASFFHYLSLALAPCLSTEAPALPSFHPEYLAAVPSFARNYFRACFAALQHGATLVLDDWQEVPTGAALAETLPTIAQQIPDSVGMIVISRNGPPVSLTRFGLGDCTPVLGVEDLKYSKAETLDLVKSRASNTSASLDVDALYDATQGWPAGVALALRSDQARLLRPGAGPSGPSQAIFDYFAAEVFDRLDDAVRQLLLKTACLDHVSARVAAHLSGNPAAETILADLARQNTFTLYRPAAGCYHYHPLFRSFLCNRLKAELRGLEPAQGLIEIGRVLCQEGEQEAAIGLFLQAKSFEDAARALRSVAESLVQQARVQTLLGWIEALPVGLIEADGWLTYWLGVCQLTTDFAVADVTLQRAYQLFCTEADRLGQMLACAAMLQQITYSYADYAGMLPWIGILEDLLEARVPFPSHRMELQVSSGLMLAMSQAVPRHPKLVASVAKVLTLVAAETDLASRAEGVSALLHFFSRFGRTAQYGNLDAQLAEILSDPGLQPLQRLRLLWLDAYRLHLSGEPRRVLEILAAARALARHEGLASEDTRMRVCELQAQEVGYATTAALTAFSELEPLMRTQPRIPLGHFLYVRAIFELGTGQAEEALRYAEESVRLVRSSHWHIGEALILTGVGEIYCALCRYADAARCVRECEDITAGLDAPLVEFNARLVQAEITRCTGTQEELAKVLGEAFSLGRRQGYANTFHTGSRLLQSLLPHALRLRVEESYCRWVIGKRGFKAPSIDDPHWPWPVRIRVLGCLEITVADERLSFSGKAQRKPLDLLKLLATSPRGMDAARVLDVLWPELEGDHARNALDIALHRLRKMLGRKETIQLIDGHLSIDREWAWVDAFALESICKQPLPVERAQPAIRILLDLYRGPLLGSDPGLAPIAVERERIRHQFVRTVLRFAEALNGAGQWQLHSELCQQALDREPLEVLLYQELIHGLLKSGQPGQAQLADQRCKQALAHGRVRSPYPDARRPVGMEGEARVPLGGARK